jgi:hypothetical protein
MTPQEREDAIIKIWREAVRQWQEHSAAIEKENDSLRNRMAEAVKELESIKAAVGKAIDMGLDYTSVMAHILGPIQTALTWIAPDGAVEKMEVWSDAQAEPHD